MIWLRFESRLAAEPPEIWLHATHMSANSEELSPLMRMTIPHGFAGLSLRDAPCGSVLFRCWVLLLGVLPFDRYTMRIDKIWDYGFQEDSSSWLQRRWRHKRTLELVPAGTRLVDELEITPRFLPEGLVKLLVQLLFQHRHSWLRQRYGVVE